LLKRLKDHIEYKVIELQEITMDLEIEEGTTEETAEGIITILIIIVEAETIIIIATEVVTNIIIGHNIKSTDYTKQIIIKLIAI
jgi:hypothetical protein